LADLNLTYPIYYQLAKKMMALSSSTCNKLLVLLGGGYNSSGSVQSYYNILCGLVSREDYIKEKDIPDTKIEEVEKLVSELKNILHPYWKL
jgi:acetoin utilization deacetylase AcuC-like enzyme